MVENDYTGTRQGPFPLAGQCAAPRAETLPLDFCSPPSPHPRAGAGVGAGLSIGQGQWHAGRCPSILSVAPV